MSEHTATPKLSGRFSKALVYAEGKHHNQVRKGGDIPYVGHLLSVASLVINDGGSEDRHVGIYARLGNHRPRFMSQKIPVSRAVGLPDSAEIRLAISGSFQLRRL